MTLTVDPVLAPYQRKGRDFALTTPRCLILDPPGVGKTHQGLGLVEALLDRGELERVLIATPGQMLGTQWVAHLKAYLPDLTVLDPGNDSTACAKLRQADGPVAVILTYALLQSRIEWALSLPWSLVVLDEVSELRGGKAQQEAARAVSRRSGRVLGLTATELENTGNDTWAILDAVGTPGLWDREAFARDFLDWKEGYTTPNGQAVPPKPQGIKREKLAEARAYLARYTLRRTEAEVGLVLPQRVGPEVVWVQPTPSQRSRLSWADTLPAGMYRYAQRQKACSVFNGQSAKALGAAEWLARNPHVEKVLLYAENLNHLDVMARLLNSRRIGHVRIEGKVTEKKRVEAVDRFNADPAIRVLLGSAVLERGLDGLKCASALLSLGTSDNPAREAQREGRLRRRGSPHETYQHVTFMVDHPHDRKKWDETLASKRSYAGKLRGVEVPGLTVG